MGVGGTLCVTLQLKVKGAIFADSLEGVNAN